MIERSLISIVITSYTMERMKDILELLDGIRAQTYPNIEVIFVVERSQELRDRIGAWIVENGVTNIRVVFNTDEQGLSAARNRGIEESKGDIIAFIDDDAFPAPDWAEEMAKTYQDDSVIGATGPAIPLWDDESMAWLPEEFYWIVGCTAWHTDSRANGITSTRNVWGMNMSFRREAFDSAGVFSNDIGGIRGQRLHGEEVELSLRVKAKTGKCIAHNPRVKVQHRVHEHRLSTGYIARYSYWMGYTRPMLKRIYPRTETDTDLLGAEYQLLRRILTRLFPSILRGAFRNPVVAWRKLWVTLVALSSVAFGYTSYLLQNLLGHRKSIPSEEKP